ncbi:MAG: hypothetical protein F7C07_07185 [Desulfurococcales archaeon]|nr:hypothetical protein [Desulfurococcales archaeon]
MYKIQEGISVLIAEVIIVAVTIAFIFLAVNWIWGIWQIQQEEFMITPILWVKASASGETELILNLRLVNEGGKAINILKIEVEAYGGYFLNSSVIRVGPGETKQVTIDEWVWQGSGPEPKIVAGDRFTVKIYTDRYGVYTASVVASS